MAKVTIQGQEIDIGRYRVTQFHLEIGAQGAQLIGLVGASYPQIQFAIPIEGLVDVNPEDLEAREHVLRYLSAAWASHQWPQINEWMADQQTREGLSVWRLRYCHTHGDVIRPLIEQEVERWLKTHS